VSGHLSFDVRQTKDPHEQNRREPDRSSQRIPMTDAIRVGQLGAGFIGKVHSLAYRGAASAQRPVGAAVELRTIADRDAALAAEAVDRYGWRSATADWREIVADPEVDLFDNAGPNQLHEEPCVAAARAGKHVLCEKPLAPDADAAYRIWRDVAATGVLHQCAFMYRFIPALALARQLIAAGELGEIWHVRARFLLSFAADAAVPMSWRFDREAAGAGALGDLGSHHVDLARFLVAELDSVAAATTIHVPQRSGGTVTNDDAFAAIARLRNGATATFEGSRVAGNHGLTSRIEVDGARGSLAFDFERLNELTVSERGKAGFRTFLVTQAGHPYSDFWLPVGIQGQHPISWADCFAHQAHCMLSAIAGGRALPPEAPTLADGYRVAEAIDTIERAAQERAWLDIPYRDVRADGAEQAR
jgi:predicted dehydrogenase